MSEKQTIKSVVSEQREPQRNGHNGSNGNGSKKDLDASSVYFKVAMPKQIVKRDGRITPFEIERIENALRRCYVSLGIEPGTPVEELAHRAGNVNTN